MNDRTIKSVSVEDEWEFKLTNQTPVTFGTTGDPPPYIPGTADPWPSYIGDPLPVTQPQRMGWLCPKCGQGVSPDVTICPCDVEISI